MSYMYVKMGLTGAVKGVLAIFKTGKSIMFELMIQVSRLWSCNITLFLESSQAI